METRGIGFQADALLEPQEALRVYFERAHLLAPRTQRVAFQEASGRILAQRIIADAAYPADARSAMDGFAARSSELPGTLRIAGEVRMGSPSAHALPPGAAMRIPTGGVLPAGADTVVPIEDAAVHGNRVRLPGSPTGQAVTPAGSDMRAGEVLLERGRRIGAPESALLATVGALSVEVYRRPRFAVISGGDELVDPACTPGPGQVRDSNRYGIAACLGALGADVRHLPTAADDAGLLEATLREALGDCDGVVLTGGSSVGEKDFTPPVIRRLGTPGVIVHGLRVKPGKPTVLGSVAGKPVIGLPGNPASALAILECVASSIVAALTGAPLRVRVVAADLGAPLRKREGWTWYVPAWLDEAVCPPLAYPLELRSSSASLLARASGFVELGESIESLSAGAQVRVRRFSGS